MFPGAIISVTIGKENTYGQVLAVERDRLRMKVLFTDEIAYLHDIHRSYRQGIIRLAFKSKKDVIDFCKTIIWYDFRPSAISTDPPSWWERLIVWSRHGNYKPGDIWWARYKIKGTLCADGWFLPFDGQAITQAFYFRHHNTLKEWQSITTNR